MGVLICSPSPSELLNNSPLERYSKKYPGIEPVISWSVGNDVITSKAEVYIYYVLKLNLWLTAPKGATMVI